MKLKLDENLGVRGAELFRVAGHDVATVVEQGATSASDAELAMLCAAEGRCLVTFDLDFADTRRYPPSECAGIVVLRLRAPTSTAQVRRISSFFTSQPDVVGRLWIVDETRARDWTV